MAIRGSETRITSCPRCYSDSFWKDGKRRDSQQGQITQRYLCRECGYRFNGEIIFSPLRSTIDRQVCAQLDGSKNLTVVSENRTTGEISESKQIQHEYAWWMKKQGYARDTIEGRTSIIRMLLNRQVNLENPESVKEYLASQDCSEGRKRNIVHAISCYYESKELTWKPPRYYRIPRIPWIPQEILVDQLIAAIPGKYQPFLQILKETGMRPGEAWNLQWNDIDFVTKQVRITPEKGSNPRVLPISNNLISMLNRLQKYNEFVFKKGLFIHFSEGFRRHKKKVRV